MKFRWSLLAIVLACSLCHCQTATSVGMVAALAPISVLSLPVLPVAFAAGWTGPPRGVIEAQFFSEDELLLLYRQGGAQRLWRVSIGSQHARALTQGDRFDLNPVIAPDHSRIAFSSRRSAQRGTGIYHIDAESGEERLLCEEGVANLMPAFSPDGRQIVFASSEKGHEFDVCLVAADGTGFRKITSTDDNDILPQFLPDAGAVVFARATWYGHYSPIASSDWHQYGLYRVSLNGGAPDSLGCEDHYEITSLAVAPDASCVMYSPQIMLAPLAAGGKPESFYPRGLRYTVLHYPGYNIRDYDYPVLSPDGRRVLFVMMEPTPAFSEVYGLHESDLTSGQTREIVMRDRPILSPRYSPSGGRVVFLVDPKPEKPTDELELWVMNTDGSELTQLQPEFG